MQLYIAWCLTKFCEPLQIHVILLDGDTGRNIYQVRKGLQDFLALKVTKKEIWNVFPELNAKVRSRKRL